MVRAERFGHFFLLVMSYFGQRGDATLDAMAYKIVTECFRVYFRIVDRCEKLKVTNIALLVRLYQDAEV